MHKVSLVYTARIGHFDEAPGPALAGFCLGLYHRFSLRYSPTSTIYLSVHFLMLLAALNENCGFNKDIVKSFMFFLKVGVIGEESIYALGRGLNIARLGHKAILVAEIVILFL